MSWATQVRVSRFEFAPPTNPLDQYVVRPLIQLFSELTNPTQNYPFHLDRLSGELDGKGMLRITGAGTQNVQINATELINLWKERPQHVVGVDLSNVQSPSFTCASRFFGAQWLYFQGSNLGQSDFKNICNLKTPEVLFLDRTAITSLTPVGQLSLRLLSAEGTKIDSIAILAGQKDLKKLFISDTPIKDLAPLSGNQSLQTLSIARTAVTNFTPLATCPALTSLFVSEDMTTNPSLIELKKALPQLRVMTV